MIYLDDRNADSTLYKAFDSRKNKYQLTVKRNFPTYSTEYTTYVWRDVDRIDLLALKFLGSSTLWWRIMDANPEILNALEIEPGTEIRIPNE